MRHCPISSAGSKLNDPVTGSRLSGIGMTSARTRERLVQRLREQGISDQRVLDRIRNVPRHLFVDEALASRAYEDTALPIGFGQTISQPYVVARMTAELLAAGDVHKVLEIGTGCGYQTVGWPARAPYDGILLTAAPPAVPPPLFDQLKVGGCLIAPVGPDGRQELIRFTKTETRIHRQSLGLVSFVPLLSGLQR